MLKTLCCTLLWLIPGAILAQGLQKLPAAGEISTGVFPNGISYYLVTNKAAYGYADYALVQKGTPDVDASRAALSALGHFGNKKPYQFLSSRGVGYSEHGYAVHGEDCTIYRFEDVPTSDVASSDTTLMMLFDLCALCPTEQAVIISGDIDAAVVKGKMSIFSLMVSKRDPLPSDEEYFWDPVPAATVITGESGFGRVSEISVSYASPRTSRENLGNIHSLVTDRMFTELDIIVRKRLIAALKAAGVPVTGLAMSRKKASDGPGDESWTVTLNVAEADALKTVGLVSDVLANIALAGVSPSEFGAARDEFVVNLTKDAARPERTNAEYVDICAASYLYGASTAGRVAIKDLQTRKQLPLDTDTGFFNQFATALLSRGTGLTVRVLTPSGALSEEGVLEAWDAPWGREQAVRAFAGWASDSLAFSVPDTKVRLRSEGKEPVTGAKLWTFSNGMRVAYSKAATEGRFYFSFIFRGGYSSVADLKPGEGAFVGDVLRFSDLKGLSCTAFSDLMRENGIDLREEVLVSEMCLSGSAPSSKLEMVLAAVAELGKQRRFNAPDFEYFLDCESLALELGAFGRKGMRAAMDTVLRPAYALTPYKYLDAASGTVALDKSLPARAESYFAKEFSKSNDGIVALIGNLDEGQAMKLLCKYLGAFGTSKAISPKPLAQYELRSGWASAELKDPNGGAGSINFILSSDLPITASRYYASAISVLQLNKALAAALSETGWWAEISSEAEFFPKERTEIYIRILPVMADGLPEGVEPADVSEVAGVARTAISEALSGTVKESDLKIYKAMLEKQHGFQIARPETLLAMLLSRYSYGKDLTSKYKETIAAISAASVKEVDQAFAEGGTVDLLVR